MAVLKADVVKKALKKKGFVEDTGRLKHLRYKFYVNGQRISVTTHLSHNGSELDDFLVRQMAEQICLSKSEFLEMVSCSLGHEELVARYADLGLLK